MDKISYALGLSIASNFKASGIDQIDISEFMHALNDVYSGQSPAISFEEAQSVMNSFFGALKNRLAKQNLEQGEEFLKINGLKKGVTTTKSGLQYEVIKMGKGKKPTANDTVRCHYHGTLINGTVFDSSMDRGEPAEFPLNAVIKGWTEVLQLMPIGSKWKVTIPANLAYGEQGAGDIIGPNTTLIFIIELLDII
ncbi:FKBP-type peptidyl-prolyl cis-trans isomerase [Falsiporphyromonas endometrii]|uniref:Peptidyl-prolyl cis-trans isomerase n=1 Tax=Falsiporphyromonas endometrii TaxID=1387297 RepID=A0ABV9K9F7_9PORP